MKRHRRIVIVGGYGAFGTRLGERLGRESDLDLVVAGRSLARAKDAADALQRTARARCSAAAIDASAPDAATLAALEPTVVVNAAGPFQHATAALAHAAIATGAHYVDLADAVAFVQMFAADVALDAGPATTSSVIDGLGRPFVTLKSGRWATVHGWQGTIRHTFPTIGTRWLGYCDVPDVKLFPARYPDLQSIEFRAGVEVAVFHGALWLLSWPGRLGWLRRAGGIAPTLGAIKRRFSQLGSDAGGMFVALSGLDPDGHPYRVTWDLEALAGHGPYIPTTPAVILARRLARGERMASGARVCVGLVTLPEIEAELADLAIRTYVT